MRMPADLKLSSPRLLLGITIILFLVTALLYSCSQTENQERDHSSAGAPAGQSFVGDEACRSCHEKETLAWKGSHHDYAMMKATDESVRGDFSNATFTHQDERYRFFRDDSLFIVEAPGPDGTPVRYQVTYTFGWTPLQQYLINYGSGKLQALNIAWDTEREVWFAMNPEEDLAHGDWLHWTGGAMNWNTMCADCHSTNLRQNYIAEADSFHTTWSSINVSCEACHGPGEEHVEFMKSGDAQQATIARIRRDLKLVEGASQKEEIGQCAPCHALREKLTSNYEHTGNFLDHFNPTLPHPEAYFPDSQIKEEVYVYGSFLQSRMFKNGIKCSDCHDSHSLELKANVTDNSLCMQCHEPRYNTQEHHFHQANTEASQCVSCHMPGRYYMEVDFRRDHSFRAPRPDLSETYGTPNACNGCHDDRSASWAAGAIREWYGPDRPDHYAEVFARADSLGPETIPELEAMIVDTAQNEIVRATAIWYLGQFPTRQSMDILGKAVANENTLIRKSAVRVLATLPGDLKVNMLQDALDDTVRTVRLGAAEGLAEFNRGDMAFNAKKSFEQAIQEYRNYLDANQYFPQGQMNRGQFFEKQGQTEKAIEAYRKALDKDSRFNPARINLAYLYNQSGMNAEAEKLLETVIEQEPSYGPAYYSLALLLAEKGEMKETLPIFEKAADLMPDNARVKYNWAIALQTLNRPKEAEKRYLGSLDLAPDNPDYLYGICTLYIQQKQYSKALPYARKLADLQPDNQQVENLLQMVEDRARQ